MTAEIIQNEINKCENDINLTIDQKNIRKYIYSIAMQRANREKLYDTKVKKYIKLGKKIEELTNGEFELDPNIVMTEYKVIKYLTNCELGVYLNKRKIKDCTLDELVAHAYMLHEVNPEFNPEIIKNIKEFYLTMEKIGTLELEKNQIMARGLAGIVGEDDKLANGIMSKEYYKFVLVNLEKGKIVSEEKDNPTYEKNKVKAIQIVNKLKTELGPTAYEFAIEMINEVFEYYMEGNKEISFDKTQKKI